MNCGKCGHQPDDHVKGKSGWGCRPCHVTEQNPRTLITEPGYFMHEFTALNKYGEKVL